MSDHALLPLVLHHQCCRMLVPRVTLLQRSGEHWSPPLLLGCVIFLSVMYILVSLNGKSCNDNDIPFGGGWWRYPCVGSLKHYNVSEVARLEKFLARNLAWRVDEKACSGSFEETSASRISTSNDEHEHWALTRDMARRCTFWCGIGV